MRGPHFCEWGQGPVVCVTNAISIHWRLLTLQVVSAPPISDHNKKLHPFMFRSSFLLLWRCYCLGLISFCYSAPWESFWWPRTFLFLPPRFSDSHFLTVHNGKVFSGIRLLCSCYQFCLRYKIHFCLVWISFH